MVCRSRNQCRIFRKILLLCSAVEYHYFQKRTWYSNFRKRERAWRKKSPRKVVERRREKEESRVRETKIGRRKIKEGDGRRREKEIDPKKSWIGLKKAHARTGRSQEQARRRKKGSKVTSDRRRIRFIKNEKEELVNREIWECSAANFNPINSGYLFQSIFWKIWKIVEDWGIVFAWYQPKTKFKEKN